MLGYKGKGVPLMQTISLNTKPILSLLLLLLWLLLLLTKELRVFLGSSIIVPFTSNGLSRSEWNSLSTF